MSGKCGAIFLNRDATEEQNACTKMIHAIVRFEACATIDSRSSSLSPLAHKRSQPASAHSLLAPALHVRHLEQCCMNASSAICDHLRPPILQHAES